jgi:hypothetical protein
MAVNSNAILTVTVQAQDQITGQNILVNATPPQVIFPSNNNLNYGGYILVNSTAKTEFFTALSPGSPFLYVRNATAGAGANELVVWFTPTTSIQQAVVLAQGGIFILGNPMLGTSAQVGLSEAAYSTTVVGLVAVMEYFWAS